MIEHCIIIINTPKKHQKYQLCFYNVKVKITCYLETPVLAAF